MFRFFWFTLKKNIKAVWLTISVVAISILMMALIGGAIESLQKTGVYSKEIVGIFNQLDSPYKEEYEKILSSDHFENIMEINYVDSIVELEKMMEDGEFHTIVIGEVVDGKNTFRVESVFPESFMLPVTANFVQTANTIALVLENANGYVNFEDQYQNQVLKTHKLSGGFPVGYDYYGIQTPLQMVVILGMLAAYSILDDKNKNISQRIKTAPISKYKVIFGRMMANIIYITCVFVITSICSHFILGVNWNGNYLIILMVFLLFSTITTILGMFAAVLTKSIIASIGIILGVGCTIWPRYSGAFSPYYDVGIMAYMSPSYHAKNVMFATIYGGSSSTILQGLLSLLLIAAVLLGMFFVAERSKINDSI